MFSLFIFCFCIFYGSEAKYAICGECPNVKIHENFDYTKLNGKWYLATDSTDFNMQGDCATVFFNHKNNNTTDVSISWVVNNTASYYNGSVTLTVGSNGGDLLLVTYTDQKTKTYSLLDVNYEHYAVILVCSDDLYEIGRTYKLLKLTRRPPQKNSCKINAGYHLNPATFILSSAAAISLLIRLQESY